jgi:hypothetical protein
VRDYIQENKMLRKVYESEKDKFGGGKGRIRALDYVANNLGNTKIDLLVSYEYS